MPLQTLYEAIDIYAEGNRLARHMNDALEPVGLTFIQAAVLIAIDDGLHQPNLVADRLCTQSSSVTKVLDRLEEAGWVDRARDFDDRRYVRLVLSEKAVSALPAILTAFRRGASTFEVAS